MTLHFSSSVAVAVSETTKLTITKVNAVLRAKSPDFLPNVLATESFRNKGYSRLCNSENTTSTSHIAEFEHHVHTLVTLSKSICDESRIHFNHTLEAGVRVIPID